MLGLRDVLSALAILYGGDAGILYGRRIVAGGTIYVEHNIYDNIYVEQEASAQYCKGLLIEPSSLDRVVGWHQFDSQWLPS